ncbi:MAG: glutamate--tRNA ligase [Opitutales bacterium]|nr:glutamate--tRNA ligase [Opitutales bacterium]
MSEVRVRFAPSPTGFFHIGSARTALFNWLYARKTGGKFVLRIEDTDKERNTPEALQVLLDGMKWLGMDWDEGPEKDGEYGPYFQSQRGEIYDKHLQILRDKGLAYDKEGAVFFKVSDKPQIIEDKVRGRVERTEEKDFVIYRSDGSPVFHFVNVVDDMTMGITHVIRGEDHLSNTSKHTELFKAFGATEPVFAHIPLILKQSGPGKMSKRDKGALIEEYQDKQFLPSAVRNYLCLLGWSPKDDREVMTIDEILEEYDFKGIQKGSAKFDEKKMAFINTEHLRQLPLETFSWMASPVLNEAGLIDEDTDEDYFQKVMMLAQPKVNSLDTLAEYVGYFFDDDFAYDEKVTAKLSKKGNPAEKVAEAKEALEGLENWTEKSVEGAFMKLAEDQGQEKPFPWFPSVRWAVSGAGGGPDLLPLLVVLGKDKVVARFERAIAQN